MHAAVPFSSEFDFAAARISTTRMTFLACVFFSLVFFLSVPSNCRFAVVLLDSAVPRIWKLREIFLSLGASELKRTASAKLVSKAVRRWESSQNFQQMNHFARKVNLLRSAKF
jgi:hypothetical protein